MPKKRDIKIIKALKRDVGTAYASLYRDHFNMVRYLVTKNSGSEEDVSDVFQETIIGLFELVQKKSFTLNCALSTLIYSIARNIWFQELRSKKDNVEFKDFEKYIEVEEEEEAVEKEALILQMESTIEAMGDPCKTILIQFYYFKKKMLEIAQMLDYKTADHAKNQKYKCLQRLKAMVRN